MDYFLARYYSSTQGRFTSPDPLLASAKPADPSSWNRYTYAKNNPLVYVDPTGLAPDKYYTARDGTIQVYETPDASDEFYVESSTTTGKYLLVATLTPNGAGLVEFPGAGSGFTRYGQVDAGGADSGEIVGQGDHFVQSEVAAALFGLVNVLNTSNQFTMSFGDMSSSNGSDPWQSGGQHHAGHGHNGTRSGLDIDFRYLNGSGTSFQSQTATTDTQFSQANNQTVFQTAASFGFTVNYSGSRGPAMPNATSNSKHNDHGHLGFGNGNNVQRFAIDKTLPNGTVVYKRK